MPTITDVAPLTPLIPLDSPELEGGPYTDEQFQKGNVSTKDGGKLYGYTYRPMRFTGDEAGVMGTSTMHPSKTVNGRLEWGEWFPWFDTSEAAAQFLKDHGYYGHVQRYALDPRTLRGESETVTLLSGCEPVTRKVTPWCTAGITEVVNAPSATECHGHLTNQPKKVHVRGPEFVPQRA